MIDRQLRQLSFTGFVVPLAAVANIPIIGDPIGLSGLLRYFRIQNKIAGVNLVLNFLQYSGNAGILVLPNTEWVSDFMFPFSATAQSIQNGAFVTVQRADAANFAAGNFVAVMGYG